MKRRRTFTVAVEYDTERDLEGSLYKIINPDAEVTADDIDLVLTEAPYGWAGSRT